MPKILYVFADDRPFALVGERNVADSFFTLRYIVDPSVDSGAREIKTGNQSLSVLCSESLDIRGSPFQFELL